MTVSDTGARFRVDSKCRVHGCKSSTTQWFLMHVKLGPAEVEDFDDRCIRMIELFGAYSVSEELQSICMVLVKVVGRMHGVACRMQIQSFLVEREC